MAKPDFSGRVNIKLNSVDVSLNFGRFTQQFQTAQKWLDAQVFNDTQPYMPMQTGTLINNSRAKSMETLGKGEVCVGTPPYGRFLYEGKVMVDPETGSPFARPGVKKVLTNRNLTYSNPKATAKWFETAKKNHGKEWVQEVKKIAGGGKQ